MTFAWCSFGTTPRQGTAQGPRALLEKLHKMRPTTLQALTWATVAAAVASALWLAIVEAEQRPTLRLMATPPAAQQSTWPVEPAAAGKEARRRVDDAAADRQPALR
jgi:hypothetical protein